MHLFYMSKLLSKFFFFVIYWKMVTCIVINPLCCKCVSLKTLFNPKSYMARSCEYWDCFRITIHLPARNWQGLHLFTHYLHDQTSYSISITWQTFILICDIHLFITSLDVWNWIFFRIFQISIHPWHNAISLSLNQIFYSETWA